MVAERHLDRARLRAVVERRRRAVRVDVDDVLGRDARVLQRAQHRLRRPAAVLVRRRQVVGVRRGAEAADRSRGSSLRAPRRLLRVLEDQDRAALAHDEAVAVARRTGARCRSSTARRAR